MKVYVITAGEYSDYHICAVTDDPVCAENLRTYYTTSPYSYVDIEEYETTEMPEKPKTCWHCCYQIGKDKSMVQCTEVRYVSKEDASKWGGETEINDVRYSSFSDCFIVYVFAKDEAHARKIAAEQIYQYKYMAESIGKDPWNDLPDAFPSPSLASATISADIIQQLKVGKPIDDFTMAFYKGDES